VPVREGRITVADLGEFGLIAALTARMPPGPGIIVGVGDDAAVLATPDSRVVATMDLLVEGRHFRRDWSGPVEIGGKAAARSLADVAAMGAAPIALLVGLAAPSDLPIIWAEDLATGLAQECARAGASVAGGDISEAASITLAVTALGDLAGGAPVTRAGARPGDLVAVAGSLGHSAAGLALLQAGLAGDLGRKRGNGGFDFLARGDGFRLQPQGFELALDDDRLFHVRGPLARRRRPRARACAPRAGPPPRPGCGWSARCRAG